MNMMENFDSFFLMALLIILAIAVFALLFPTLKKWIRLNNKRVSPSNNGKHNSSDHHSGGIAPSLLMKEIEKLSSKIDGLQNLVNKYANSDDFRKSSEKNMTENLRLEESNQRLKYELEHLKTSWQEREIVYSKMIQEKEDKFNDILRSKDKEVNDKLKDVENQWLELLEVSSKSRKVEHLREYASKVSSYLVLLESILKDANGICDVAKSLNGEAAKIISLILQQALANTETISRWKQICEDIKVCGIIVLNKDIKNCFQKDDESEQLKEFKKRCISELKSYTNEALILCECFANLDRFVAIYNIESIKREFSNQASKVREMAKEVGITAIEVVRLFTHLDEYNNIKATSEQISLPYSIVESLSDDYVARIISFGMKSEFDDSISTTKVLTR